MAKRTTLASLANALARDAARAKRQSEIQRKKQIKAQETHKKALEQERKRAELEERRQLAQSEKERKQLEKEAKEQYLADRLQETEDNNSDVTEYMDSLSTILQHTLGIDDTIAFDSLRVKYKYPSFSSPQDLTRFIPPPNEAEFLKQVKPMGLLENALGMKGRYQRELQAARNRYAEAYRAYEIAEAERVAKLEQLQAEYTVNRDAFFRKVQQREQEVILLEEGYNGGEVSAITAYTTMVLERSEYPDDFPQQFRLAYLPESKELVIEYELPAATVIPTALEYKYNKTKDTIEEKPRKGAEIKALYQDIIAAVTLRTIHEVLEADQGNHVQVIVFNGFVAAVDPATGRDVRPCVVSVRTTKENFVNLDLSRVDKLICLRNLGAQVSSRPDERLPVKPVVEFDMVDKRFVDEADILSNIDSRPNLMDLSPNEFENLVSNLFNKMGLETKLTRASKDGGVDAVAFDIRPILGGKVVIQAKRYKNTVGVSAVRDLYGTMLNEGASKGIIVATSSYGPDAYEFSKDKPLELIDGGGLLYLLEQVGIKARIIMPQE